MDFENKASESAVMSAFMITKGNRNERGPDELRNGDWWTNEYQNWDETSFKKRVRVSRDTFKFILGVIIRPYQDGAHSHETSPYSTCYPVGFMSLQAGTRVYVFDSWRSLWGCRINC